MVIDYLIIGHVSRDVAPDGALRGLGGSVSYCALTARALAQRVAVLTSASDDMLPLLKPLESIPLRRIPAREPTTFEIDYTPEGRILRLLHRAAPLRFEELPSGWRSPAIVHLAPIADEVAPSLASRFPGAIVVATPQGWMRRWDESRRVGYAPWASAAQVLPHLDAVVLSLEDVGGDEALARHYAGQVAVLVVTRGPQNATLYIDGRPHVIPIRAVKASEATGAGDIFSTAFFVRLRASGDPQAAARFAAALASASVMRVGMDSIPDAKTIKNSLSNL
jgi:sugar/nucleoside kinase (ribokinase family)